MPLKGNWTQYRPMLIRTVDGLESYVIQRPTFYMPEDAAEWVVEHQHTVAPGERLVVAKEMITMPELLE